MKQVGFSTAQEGDLYTDLESAKKNAARATSAEFWRPSITFGPILIDREQIKWDASPQ